MSKQHPHQELIQETLQLMQLSSMSDQERNLWTVLLPSMEKSDIEKLKASLAKEVEAMTDLYLSSKQS